MQSHYDLYPEESSKFMLTLIGTLFKYTLLTLTILVLSHIIQIEGVTISQHVWNGMHYFSSYSPKAQAKALTEDFTKSVNKHTQDLNRMDAEVTPEDQKVKRTHLF